MAIISKISSLKPGTRKLMDVLKRIKTKQLSRGQQKLGYYSQPTARFKLAQSHKQVKRMGKGKGYREYLKRGTK